MSSFLLLAATGARTLSQAPDLAVPWARIILGLLFCLALAALAILAIRHRQGLPTGLGDLRAALSRPGGESLGGGLAIEQRVRVTPASQIVVLRCAERRYLVHLGVQGAQLLDRLADAPPAAREDA